MKRPSVTADELGVMLLIVAMQDPERVHGKDEAKIRSAIYKAKSMVDRTDNAWSICASGIDIIG